MQPTCDEMDKLMAPAKTAPKHESMKQETERCQNGLKFTLLFISTALLFIICISCVGFLIVRLSNLEQRLHILEMNCPPHLLLSLEHLSLETLSKNQTLDRQQIRKWLGVEMCNCAPPRLQSGNHTFIISQLRLDRTVSVGLISFNFPFFPLFCTTTTTTIIITTNCLGGDSFRASQTQIKSAVHTA
ncbi:putative HEAT repeat-containing domain protein [Trichinella spiralis]|uniref:putative HEAT repeat-containing domain protein n=1 Tax=Trichinella spiralis TaxID=6334 RepID=UPI0001EFC927|nr:putative HEAT repeat-containing domain protein [Trichinella spiralis]